MWSLISLPLGVGVLEEAATKSFDQFLDKGILGAFVVLFLVAIVCLYWEGRSREKQLVGLLERVITLSEGSKNASTTNSVAIDGFKQVMEATRRAIEEHGHDIEKGNSELRHSLSNHSMILDSIAKILEKIKDRGLDRGGQ